MTVISMQRLSYQYIERVKGVTRAISGGLVGPGVVGWGCNGVPGGLISDI